MKISVILSAIALSLMFYTSELRASIYQSERDVKVSSFIYSMRYLSQRCLNEIVEKRWNKANLSIEEIRKEEDELLKLPDYANMFQVELIKSSIAILKNLESSVKESRDVDSIYNIRALDDLLTTFEAYEVDWLKNDIFSSLNDISQGAQIKNSKLIEEAVFQISRLILPIYLSATLTSKSYRHTSWIPLLGTIREELSNVLISLKKSKWDSILVTNQRLRHHLTKWSGTIKEEVSMDKK